MKAYLFSIGESTTELAKWSLERLGIEVILIEGSDSFHSKYCRFVEMALQSGDQWVLRMDADVIVNKRVADFINHTLMNAMRDEWWYACKLFCFLRMDLIDGCPNLISREALEVCKKRLPEVKKELRPETELTRMPEFMNPRRFRATDYFVGYHGYRQRDEDIARVMNMKAARGQLKDWDQELIKKLDELTI